MRLLLLHPEVAFRDCNHCQKFLYSASGQLERDRDGNPRLRPPRTAPPCRYQKNGCPKGTPENQKSLSQRNLKAYRHYLECKATGQFPCDAIVRRNAGIIRAVEDAVNAERILLTQLRTRR